MSRSSVDPCWRANDPTKGAVDADKVYAFAPDPRNLPRWAAGLAGNRWVADSPMGKVRIRFAARNLHGVLDHDVTLESGVTVHNPMRVPPPRGEGSEFVFALIRRPGMATRSSRRTRLRSRRTCVR